MDHGPAVHFEEREDLIAFKSKTGIKLFFVYALVYVVFVVINNSEFMFCKLPLILSNIC